LVDDGLFVFKIERKGDEVYAISETEGILKSKKTVNIMDLNFDFPVLHERDMNGLRLAKETGINYIALSFVRNGEDLRILRSEMKKMDLNAKIVAKIETRKAINNIDEIIEETDAVMIARGDMGVEMPMEEVPFYQKLIIKKCMEKGKPVITATQMLESMTYKYIPTRAETSDVANAIYDFTDATMLSGETASGKYPLEAVKMMAKIAGFTESKNKIKDIRELYNFNLNDDSEMVCDSAFNLHKVLESRNDDIKGFIVFTETGKTVRMLARYRPHVPIFAFCPDMNVAKSLAVSFGVIPVVQSSLKRNKEIVKDDLVEATNYLYKNGLAQKQDRFIAMHGDYWSTEVGASTIKIISNCCS
jgi:pyruvate kinase